MILALSSKKVLVKVRKLCYIEHKSEVIGMVLTEFDEKKFVEDLQKESYDSGYDSGIDKVNSLIRILFAQKRYADLERSANDPKYQAQLIKELLPEDADQKYQ